VGAGALEKKGTDLEHYLKDVKKGDMVQVSFVEAVALDLKPVRR
jgi:hypothetical protein